MGHLKTNKKKKSTILRWSTTIIVMATVFAIGMIVGAALQLMLG